MTNTTLIPEIGNWTQTDTGIEHAIPNPTLEQVIIINKFVSKHKNYYICSQEDKIKICKTINKR